MPSPPASHGSFFFREKVTAAFDFCPVYDCLRPSSMHPRPPSPPDDAWSVGWPRQPQRRPRRSAPTRCPPPQHEIFKMPKLETGNLQTSYKSRNRWNMTQLFRIDLDWCCNGMETADGDKFSHAAEQQASLRHSNQIAIRWIQCPSAKLCEIIRFFWIQVALQHGHHAVVGIGRLLQRQGGQTGSDRSGHSGSVGLHCWLSTRCHEGLRQLFQATTSACYYSPESDLTPPFPSTWYCKTSNKKIYNCSKTKNDNLTCCLYPYSACK